VQRVAVGGPGCELLNVVLGKSEIGFDAHGNLIYRLLNH
jgi:hypothetical protein